jgi:hypothetical protein
VSSPLGLWLIQFDVTNPIWFLGLNRVDTRMHCSTGKAGKGFLHSLSHQSPVAQEWKHGHLLIN